ncbi:MAG: glycosyltransferase [Proteobacteria bacterium]|nr:glycosyltransferase [Pseudomonadota bacterium]
MAHFEILVVNLEGYGKGGLGTLAYHLHESLLEAHISSVLIASGNPKKLPNVLTLDENDYKPVPHTIEKLSTRYRVILGRNELATLSPYLSDLILITGGTAYLQEWQDRYPHKTTLDFLRLKNLPRKLESPRIRRERLALDKATKILSAPGLNSRVLRRIYPEFTHKIFEVPQIFRRFESHRPWESREIDLIAVAQWTDRGVDRRVKGYRLLARTVDLLSRKGLQIVVVGEVPFPIEGVIHTGWIDHQETLKLIENTRVFICPSRSECYSQAVVEALQLGCNVVISRNAEPHGFCHPELIASYGEGSFSQKIEKALTRKFPIKPLPLPKDSLDLLMSALRT